MLICISNNKERNSSMYDYHVDLNTFKESKLINNWLISKKGLTNNNKIPFDKYDLQKNYKKGINQIVSNDRHTNYTFETPTGEIIEFVGEKTHLEKEL